MSDRLAAVGFDVVARRYAELSVSERDGLLDLRYRVLRAPLGLSRASASFAGDDDSETVHLLAIDPAGAVIGCATLLVAEADKTAPANAPRGRTIQLRGMAVDDRQQGKGVGRAIVDVAHAYADNLNLPLWCNARMSAAPFYAACGWQSVGEIFDIPNVGPHTVMVWGVRSLGR